MADWQHQRICKLCTQLYIRHNAGTPNIPQVKIMHFNDAAVSHNNYRIVHPVHREAMIRASQRTTDHIYSNIIKPMPSRNHIEDITRYMTKPRARPEPGVDVPDMAQPSKRRPGTRSKSGAKKSEQRPSVMHTKRRQTRVTNEHIANIGCMPHDAGKVRPPAVSWFGGPCVNKTRESTQTIQPTTDQLSPDQKRCNGSPGYLQWRPTHREPPYWMEARDQSQEQKLLEAKEI
jgi:hypothetical protein